MSDAQDPRFEEEPCWQCGGDGWFQGEDCDACAGTGRQYTKRAIELQIAYEEEHRED